MKISKYVNFLLSLLIFSLIAAGAVSAAEDTTYSLPNGMSVILKENHSSPMISSSVFVKAGSKYETAYENGLTHLLEHLLFDGTVAKSREELDRTISDLGGYINAFTRKDMTVFFTLMPAQFNSVGMTVMADMLFNSTIPESELPKERKVVIEEINRDASRPDYAAETFFEEQAYAGTGYERPVLGYKDFIENIPREAIIAFWKKYYRPENMILLVIGDFDRQAITADIEKIFSNLPDSDLTVDSLQNSPSKSSFAHSWVLTGSSRKTTALEKVTVIDTVSESPSTYISLSMNAPRHDDDSYLPFDLLVEYLNLDEISPLKKALKSRENPLVEEVSVGLQTYKEFSRLDISVITEKANLADSIVNVIVNVLQNMGQYHADEKVFEGLKTSILCNEIYNQEKLHYFSFLIAERLINIGWDFVKNYPELIEKVNWPDCPNAARVWFDDPKYIATIVKPETGEDRTLFQPEGLSLKQITSHFDTASLPEYDLSKGVALTYPEPTSLKLELNNLADYFYEVLPNGLSVIIKSSPESRVFAVNILGKNRSALESEAKAGLTDFVNRCLDKGTWSRSAADFAEALNSIGANLTLHDNPWIPYDDGYTTPQYSFIKFETIEKFAPKGWGLLMDMLNFPAFDSSQVEQVRQEMQGILRRGQNSPGTQARQLFYKTLFANHPFALPVSGTSESIAAITRQDLIDQHHKVYSPENMILAVTTSRPVSEIQNWIDLSLGRLSSIELDETAVNAPEPVFNIKQAETKIDVPQLQIYLGNTLPGAGSPELPAITVAARILSDRLFDNLREKQGLAYSVGTGTRFDRNFGWYYNQIGTAPENFDKAKNGIILEIQKLQFDGPTPEELESARNQIWGSMLRARLTRLNQGYYLARDLYLGHEPGYDSDFLRELNGVTYDDIRRVMSKYFSTESYVMAVAGQVEEKE